MRDPMPPTLRVLIAALLLIAAPVVQAEVSESSVTDRIKTLRSLDPATRPAVTIQIANDIRSLPAGLSKVKLATGLAGLVTEGDQGQETVQAAADTLAKALAESPVPAKDGQPQYPYVELANLARYENVTVTLDDPLYAMATRQLIANDADVEKAGFTLKDLHGKSVTLSKLRGKVVVINFWATWCPPCRLEMPDLDAVYMRYQSQGLVVLSISSEDAAKIGSFLAWTNYHPTVLLDPEGKVAQQFHVEGIPRTFVFNRKGKLVAEAIDQCTQHQFLGMLAKTDLQP
jgi:thiol-disulfide isomerase/thioredoxin